MSPRRKPAPDPMELVHNHLKLPRWLHDAIRRRADEEKRQIQAQVCVDLESIPYYAALAPKPTTKKGSSK